MLDLFSFETFFTVVCIQMKSIGNYITQVILSEDRCTIDVIITTSYKVFPQKFRESR